MTTKIPESERRPSPDLTGKDLDGHRIRLSDFRGRVVVLNVWASWCAPCRAEADDLEHVHRKTAAQGVRFLGLNSGDLRRENAREFERTHKITYPSLFDPASKLVLSFPKGTLNPQDIPATLIIDRKGRIAVRALHAIGKDELHSAVQWVLAGKS